MKFGKLLEISLDIVGNNDLGILPTGHRSFFELGGGVFSGPELNGVVKPKMSGEWGTVTDTGYVIPDVRLTLQTDDDALIYVEYTGKIEVNEKVQKALAGEISLEYGDNYFFTNPRMQTSSEKYKYLNNIFCVGQGKFSPGKVHYTYYKIDH